MKPLKGLVYKMYWPETGHYYIGLTRNYKSRVRTHLSAMYNGNHPNKMVQIAYIVYGEPIFVVLKKGLYYHMQTLESTLIRENSDSLLFLGYPSISGNRNKLFKQKMTSFISSI